MNQTGKTIAIAAAIGVGLWWLLGKSKAGANPGGSGTGATGHTTINGITYQSKVDSLGNVWCLMKTTDGQTSPQWIQASVVPQFQMPAGDWSAA